MSPTYQHANGETFRRKNMYMPCVIGERFDSLSPEEQVRLYRATYWADNITAAEWPVVLRKPDCTPYAKSRLKKKAAGWIVALQRIALLHPELFEAIVKQATETYRDQVEDEPAVLHVWDGRLFESGEPWLVGAPVDWNPED